MSAIFFKKQKTFEINASNLLDATKEVYSEFKTDKDGKFITYLKLVAGNYTLYETSSPKGYLLDEKGIDFTIGNDTHYSYTTYGPFITVYFNNSPIKGQIEVIKDGEVFKIEDGTFNLNTSDDSIHSNNYIGISNGTYSISSGDDGIHADNEIIIEGGSIDIKSKVGEGTEVVIRIPTKQ